MWFSYACDHGHCIQVLSFAVCWGAMKADWETFSDGSLWRSLVDCVECGQTLSRKLLIVMRKNDIVLPSIRVTGMFLS